MHSALKTVALTCALTCGWMVSAANAQTGGAAGNSGIVVLTERNEADVVNAANNLPVLAAVGSPAFFASYRAELTRIAAAHKKQLLVVYADPSTIHDADQIVAQLTNGDVHYPMVIYLGAETRILRGTIAPGEITTLVNAETRH